MTCHPTFYLYYGPFGQLGLRACTAAMAMVGYWLFSEGLGVVGLNLEDRQESNAKPQANGTATPQWQ